jgi:hypothetical protein
MCKPVADESPLAVAVADANVVLSSTEENEPFPLDEALRIHVCS